MENIIPMNLRDYFAAMAMQAIVRNSADSYNATPEGVAEKAYAMADAMVAHREKQKSNRSLDNDSD